jgi:hypothetical protein
MDKEGNKMKAEKIIVKREPKRNGNSLILFFPDTCTIGSRYKIEYWSCIDRMHGEADFEYYRECTPVKYDDSSIENEAVKFVSNYIKYVQTLPDMADYKVKIVKRITRK